MKRSTSDAANANTQPQNQVPSIDSVIRPVPLPHLRTDQHDPHTRQQCLPSWSALNPDSRILPPLSQQDGPATPTAKMTVDETVASTDLQNPADALEFLANVAERDSGSNQLPPMHSSVYGRPSSRLNVPGLDGSRPSNQPTPNNVIDYPPLTKGQLSLEMLQALLYR